MGTYNVLIADVRCSNCNNLYQARVQFKYGDTWQFEYKIGDKLKWGGNDIGIPNVEEAKAYGILEYDVCPICGDKNRLSEFDIHIEKDVIVKITNLQDLKDYFIGEGNYKILVE